MDDITYNLKGSEFYYYYRNDKGTLVTIASPPWNSYGFWEWQIKLTKPVPLGSTPVIATSPEFSSKELAAEDLSDYIANTYAMNITITFEEEDKSNGKRES